ncbi:MAG TPA: FliH/SctL family protein [Acidobacteriaceae bacterium]|nr:FliH/SctL family protein [Acidobacteriaceae bacterium]
MLGNAENRIRPMQYPILPGAQLAAPQSDGAEPGALEKALAEREQQFAHLAEAARREAFEKGREAARGEQAAWRQQCAAELSAALESFRAGRDDYLARVEREVVRLALAIAERVLHREAQMDPLLLSGAVRVALGQLAESTEVKLRVPAAQREMWAEMLRLMPSLPLRPEVVADPEMEAPEAALEAGLGTVDLGVRAQIAEIERGFFDLLEVRRETRAGEAAARRQG